MPRIAELPIEDWNPELRTMVDPDSVSPLQLKGAAILARAPHMALANFAFMGQAMKGRMLPPRLLELVRLRIAFHNQCRSCMAMRYRSAVEDGLTEDLVCSLEEPGEAPDLSEREKAALDYADLFSNDHLAIDDDTIGRLRKHFSESEIVELGLFTGYYLGIGRFLASLDIVEELPGDFQDTSKPTAPWKTRSTVLVGR